MGRIKSKAIKRTAEKLVDEIEFSSKFEKNKNLLEGAMPSKKMRNELAGYLTRLVRQDN